MGDSDVPPLEDMSGLLQQMEALRENTDNNKNSSHSSSTNILPTNLQPESHHDERKTKTAETRDIDRKVCKPSSTEVCKPKTNTNSSTSSKTSSGMFGGFKKGFLFGDSKSKPDKEAVQRKQDIVKKTEQVDKSEEESIPFIKPNTKQDDSKFRFSEVQQVMQASQQFLNKKDWLTEDLMTQIEKNETLSKRLADPTFVQAIAEFQKDPKGASEKYNNNKEMQTFFTDFCSLMGSHFTKMADSKPMVSPEQPTADISVHDSAKPAPEEEQKVQDVLADPELRDILLDPKIQILFEMLRTKPEQAPGYLQSADNEMKMKIKKLMEAGLLQLQI